MLEKIKKWNWKLIASILLCFVWLWVFTLVGETLNAPEFTPLWDDGVTTDPEIFGFVVCLQGFIFGFMLVRFRKTMDMIPWKRRKK